jgi:Fur family transcriptional regulator, ferric uptake regulator
MNLKDTVFCEDLLKEHSYRVTPGRMALLLFLKHAKKPLSAGDIQKQLSHPMNKVTLYRALEDFSQSKIVAKISLRDSVTYYEFIHAGHHHHHIVCEQCGKLEDIESCDAVSLQKEILKHSKNFKSINSHSLEFFGICKGCTA